MTNPTTTPVEKAATRVSGTIKPLVWEKHPSHDIWSCDAILGTYKVFGMGPMPLWDFDSPNGKASFTSLTVKSAKAAAQADYEARILAAIQPTPEAKPVASSMNDVLARVRSDTVNEAVAGNFGVWLSCTGCQELDEGLPTGLYHSVMRCHLGLGCDECGGIGAIWDTTDYADMGEWLDRTDAPQAGLSDADEPQGDLLPCPFCGGAVIDNGYGIIHKLEAPCILNAYGFAKEGWKRRALPAARAEVSENYTDLLERLDKGLQTLGLAEDNSTEIVDIDEANELLLEARAAISTLMEARANVSIDSALSDLIYSYAVHLEGRDTSSPYQKALSDRVATAAPYGSTAYKMAMDDDQGTHAMAKAFLLALIDPTHEDLDYLRADPAAGPIERERRATKAQTVEVFPHVGQNPQDEWLIHKAGRGWFRPNAQGYTNTPSEAGRYSHADALRYSHPKGWGGPRDEITIKQASEVIAASSNASMAEAAKVLLASCPNPIFDILKPVLMGEVSQRATSFNEDGDEIYWDEPVDWSAMKEIITMALRALTEAGQ